MLPVELFLRFAMISLVAFGGGQAALPLVERMAVQDTGWITPATFGTAVAFAYLTPGPVLITATFIGYQVLGFGGALSATVGAFLAPWALATLAAQGIKRFAADRRLRAFGEAAAPAVIGILGVTVLSVGREALTSGPSLAIGAAVFALACWTRAHPVVLLGLGGVLGWLAGKL